MINRGKTLIEHVREAGRARWKNRSEEERKEHSAMMSAKRWPKKTTSTGEK